MKRWHAFMIVLLGTLLGGFIGTALAIIIVVLYQVAESLSQPRTNISVFHGPLEAPKEREIERATEESRWN